MLNNILEQIKHIPLNRYGKIDKYTAYQFFYMLIKDDSINSLNPEDVKLVIDQLGIKISDILYIASEKGNIISIEYIFYLQKSGYGIFLITENNYCNAFQYAARNSRLEVMSWLLKSLPNYEINSKLINSDYNKAFIEAASNGNIKTMKILLSYVKDPNNKEEIIHTQNDEAFVRAATNGNINVMKYLLLLTQSNESRNKMIHAQNDEAFIEASHNGHVETMKFLVKITHSQEAIYRMIHINNYEPFRKAANQDIYLMIFPALNK